MAQRRTAQRPSGSRFLPRLRQLTIPDLEGELPVFPLAGALLLPRGRLPLNIFEPRYLAMIDDALRSRRLIGMVQPQGEEADDEADAADDDDDDVQAAPEPFAGVIQGGASGIVRATGSSLYQVGCVGRLTSFVEREDGTIAVTLAGIARFRISRELETVHGYRRVIPDFTAYTDDLVEPGPITFDRDALMSALRRYFSMRGFEARWEAIEQMDDETLVITLSMICPFAVAEKQALLEAQTLSQRATTLLTLLEMAGHETDDGRMPHAA